MFVCFFTILALDPESLDILIKAGFLAFPASRAFPMRQGISGTLE